MEIKETALGLLRLAPQRVKNGLRTPVNIAFNVLSDISEAISEDSEDQGINRGNSPHGTPQSSDDAEKRDTLFRRFEEVKEDCLHLYIAYYLGTYSWSEVEELEIHEIYGKQKTIPSIEPERFTQGDRSSEIHLYLLEWIDSYQVTTYPRLGLFDNYHPAFKQWGAEEAERIYQERQSLNLTEP